MHNLPRTMRLVALLLATCGVLCEGMAQTDGFCCDPNYPQSYDPFNCPVDNIPDNDCLPSGCTNPDAFNYDDEAGWDDGSCYAEADLPPGWTYAATPSSSTFLGNVTVDGLPLAEPGALAAFSEEGLCVGWAIPVEADGLTYVALTLYGDDPTTEAIDGMLSGQTFSLALHLAATDTVLGFDMNNEAVSFDGWTNTNGAPLAAYGDASTTYDFDLTDDCLDASACNFHPASDSNDDCLYPEPAYDCEGNCLDDVDGDGICDPFEVPGCTIANACNFNPEATDDDGSCATLDECGVCGGSGIAEGDCDCNGNQLDALGVCGGSCMEDIDGDGVCDDVDPCVGTLDACGVCNGPGAIYACGCDGIPEGDCDCEGNVDALGVRRGRRPFGNGVCDDAEVYGCTYLNAPNYEPEATADDGSCVVVDCDACDEDLDEDGVCDDEDDCVGELDECGVCNGPGAVYDCGCQIWPANDCDCDGNQLDALGVCGGGCPADIDGDGICDDEDDCLYDFNNNGVCDDAEVPGCTYDDAVNYNENATVDDGSCEMGASGSDNVWATCYGDLNADGLVQLNDLLGLLTVYGNDCE